MPSGAGLIPNIDYLGRCYDVVDADPLDLGSSAKYENAIDIDVSEGRTVSTRDGTYTIPQGVHHKAIFSMSWETQSAVISSSFEFQQEFKLAVHAEAGVEGGFEFSGSASQLDIEHRTESRKQSFVYSRAYQQNHGLSFDLENESADLRVTPEFKEAVERLPIGDFEKVVTSYENFVRRFGTHFAKEIILGGLAFQRTSGSSSVFLKSKKAENELKASASLEMDLIKAKAGAEKAHSEAAKVDSEHSLERTSLEFRGGDGSPSGIDSSWIMSLHERPAVVKSRMERLSSLLTRRFFPQDADIEDRACLLDLAISDWIMRKGRPSCDTAPLRYGEPLVLTRPWRDGKIIQPCVVNAWVTDQGVALPVQPNGQPDVNVGEILAVRLESPESSRANTAVLAGDPVRIKAIHGSFYLGLRERELVLVDSISKAGSFTVMLEGDDLRQPRRLGEYLLEPDMLVFGTGRVGVPEWAMAIRPSGRFIYLRDFDPTDSTGFSLKRCTET